MTKRLRRGTKIIVLDEKSQKYVPYIVDIFNKQTICAYSENGEHERVLLYPFPFFFYPEGAKQPIEHYRIMDAHYTNTNDQATTNP